MSKSSTRARNRNISLTEFSKRFSNNEQACQNTLFKIFHPAGFICPKCGCTHYINLASRPHVYQCCHCRCQVNLFAGCIFQDNKMPLYTLLLGIYLFVSNRTGISEKRLSNFMGVNRKTAQLLARKLRYLMELDDNSYDLSTPFLEGDAFYIGGKSKSGKRGLGTDKLPFLIVLGTDRENRYPVEFRADAITSESKKNVLSFFERHIKYNKRTVLNTDGDGAYNILNDKLHHKSQIIDYEEDEHQIYWIHKVISNIKSNILGIYRGIAKPYLESYVHEYEWRFRHRHDGRALKYSVMEILCFNVIMTRKMFKTHFASN